MFKSQIFAFAFTALTGLSAASNAYAVDHPDLFVAASPDFPDNGMLSSDNASSGKGVRGDWDCGGKNITPAIVWSNAPADTKSFAVLMDDPDAAMGRGAMGLSGNHWIAYGITASAKGLARGAKEASDSFVAGDSARDKLPYHGPCAEPGAKAHHFLFYVYALTIAPDALPRSLNKADFFKAIVGKNTAMASFAARYQRAPDGSAMKEAR